MTPNLITDVGFSLMPKKINAYLSDDHLSVVIRLKHASNWKYRPLGTLHLIHWERNMKHQTHNVLNRVSPGLAPLLAIALSLSFAHAEDKTRNVLIPSQSLATALLELSEQADTVITVPPHLVNGKNAPSIKGDMLLSQALDKLLSGSGLQYVQNRDGAVTISAIGAIDSSVSTDTARKLEKDSNNTAIEEVIVSAQKREQSLRDVPISIVALSADELEDKHINDLDTLVFSVPGLSIYNSGDFRRLISLRGVANIAGSSSLIGLYLDEVSVTSYPDIQFDLRTYDLERIEVLRGPQGTLYGGGSAGGTIRFITKNPQLEALAAQIDTAASFTQGGESSQEIKGMLNVPLNDTLGLRIAGMIENQGGWADLSHPTTPRENTNERKLEDLRVKLLWAPTESLEVNTTALVHHNTGSNLVGENEDGTYITAFDSAIAPTVEDEYDIFNMTLTYDFDAMSFLSTSSYFTLHKNAKNGGGIYDGLHAQYNSTDDARGVMQEMRLNSLAENAWRWTAGLFYRKFDYSWRFPQYMYGNPDSVLPVYSFGSDELDKSWAAFGDVSFAVSEKLELGVGLRYFEEDRSSYSVPYLVDGVAVAPRDLNTATFTATSPRFYANYDFSDNIMVYGSIAKGFRSGGFTFFPGYPNYQPEQLWTYEVGTKLSALDGRLSAELALYYSDYKDYIVRGRVTQGQASFSLDSNAGDAEIKGIEWGFSWFATDNLSLVFNGNYIDSTIARVSVEDSRYQVGDRLPQTPKYLVTLAANYDYVLDGRPGYARLDYSQRGRVIMINRTSDPILTGTSDVLGMLNFNIGWQWSDSISVGAFAQNLLNERGAADPNTYPSRYRPRTFGVRVGWEL